jgi:glutathione S-transferase
LAFPLDEYDDDDIDVTTRKLEEVLEVYEHRLSESRFLAGNKFTLADLAHLPNCHYIAESDKFRYLLESRRNVDRWWAEISSRRSWKQVVRDMKTVEQQQYKLESLEELRRRRKSRGAVVRQVRKDPRKHIIAKSETTTV